VSLDPSEQVSSSEKGKKRLENPEESVNKHALLGSRQARRDEGSEKDHSVQGSDDRATKNRGSGESEKHDSETGTGRKNGSQGSKKKRWT